MLCRARGGGYTYSVSCGAIAPVTHVLPSGHGRQAALLLVRASGGRLTLAYESASQEKLWPALHHEALQGCCEVCVESSFGSVGASGSDMLVKVLFPGPTPRGLPPPPGQKREGPPHGAGKALPAVE